MPLFEFSLAGKNTYEIRRNRALQFNAIMTSVIFLTCALTTFLTAALGTAIIFFVLRYLKIRGEERYRIVAIRMDDSNINISYDDRSIIKQLSGSHADFKFKKRNVYLAVYYQGKLKIKQFEQDELRLPVFDRIIQTLNEPLNALAP
ncbi:hypothetical protein GFS24_06495 [Chitinophaga sp. SYP-B3965]|uniref:hypothetical protein n=1 Tax=Chitinophaga sp. SYP-B3965 TaxID=2663120 RepID=UPI001299CBF6|nr:hypothetical protein [Chitinophaga sp. SYP-B3965]MRG44754.1 hypothetical protein [Chitinophaga sp. SYP-B3965]